MSFVDLEIETDPVALSEAAVTYLQSRIAGWTPAPANLDVWLIEAFAQIGAQVRDISSQVPAAIFREYGRKVIGLAPVDATRAQITSTWTMRDNAGYTVPAGTVVAIRRPEGDLVGFETVADVVVPNGSTVATPVILYATEAGAASSGITPVAADVALQDALAFVLSVTTSGSSTGGVDAEEDDDYLSRLSDELRLLTPRPILAADFAVLARRVTGVHRAVAIDGYFPGPPVATGQERCVSVACVDSLGAVVSAPTKTAVDALLQGMREVSFLVFVIDPTFTAISVTATLVAKAGQDTAALQTAAVAALQAMLSPASWGVPDDGSSRDWRQTDRVRYLEVASRLDIVDGCDYVSALTVNGGTSDIVLSGAAPLTQAGTITVTVVAGS